MSFLRSKTPSLSSDSLEHVIETGESRASQVALVATNLPEMRVQSLGQEDPLEEGMAIHSSILAWRIPWAEEPGGLWSRVAKSWTQLKQLSSSMCLLSECFLYPTSAWKCLGAHFTLFGLSF